MRKVVSVILADGKGKRMSVKVNKQFVEISGKPIIYYTLKTFEECKGIDEIILVPPEDEINYFKREIEPRFDLKISKIIEDGKERQDSVYNALSSMEDCDIVLAHDGARASVSDKIIGDGMKYSREFGTVAPGVMPKGTIKVKNLEGFSVDTPNRASLVAAQTPQCFKYNLIKEGHNRVKNEKTQVTGNIIVIELLGEEIYLFEGDCKSIKVTAPEDLILAEHFVK